MARIFGALANAASRYSEGANRKQQYLNEQDRLAREEQRRVFEFAATQDRLKEQARQAMQDREQERLFRAQEAGYADAPDVAGVRAGGAALSAITGMQMGNGVGATAKEDTPYTAEVEGRQIRAQQKPSQYLTIGGKTLRRNQQSDANAVAQQEEAKALWDLKMKREVAQANKDNEFQNRKELATLAAGLRQPRAPRTQIVQNDQGEYVIVDLDQIGPTGLKAPKKATSTTAESKQAQQLWGNYRKEEPVKSAQAIAGPVRSINAALEQGVATGNRTAMLSAIYQIAKLNDPRTGVRPSELELVGETTSLDERVRRVISKWNSGKMLTPDMIRDMQEFVSEQSTNANESVRPVQAIYGQRAREAGLEQDSAYIAPDPISGAAQPRTRRSPGAPVPNRSGEADSARAQRLINNLLRPK